MVKKGTSNIVDIYKQYSYYPELPFMFLTSRIYKGNNLVFQKDFSSEPLTFLTLAKDTRMVAFSSESSWSRNLLVSTDKINWTTYTITHDGVDLTGKLPVGTRVYIKANHQTLAADTYRYIYFKVSNAVAVEGNIESLLGTYVTNQANYTYYRLFWDANIVFANNLVLPNTIAKAYAYYGMFEDCQNLLTAPALPATTLTTSCYKNMFKGCTRLKSQIVLPASTLKTQCYYGMFEGCTNLCHITCLATDISASNCTTNWVNGVAASGTFTKADGMTSWTTGNNGIPSGWTVQNA